MRKVKIERCVLCGPKISDEHIAHFNFPKDKFDEWKSFCVKADPTKVVYRSSKLCCIHFTEESFTSLFHRHVLKKDAIPSLISNHSDSIIRKCNHNVIEQKPVVETHCKNYYVLHQSWNYCLLCRSKRIGVGAFQFPKEDNIRKQWIEFCQIDITKINIRSRLCQYHFTEDDFYITNCGRVNLKKGAIPSIRVMNVEECSRKEEIDDMDSVIPPKRLQLYSETRCYEPINTSLLSCEDGNMSSTDEMLELKECSFCKITSVDVVQFRFSNNTAMRSFMITKCGISPLHFDTIHTVCISHFDSEDIDIDNNGKKSVKDRAFPWCYFSQMIANSSGNISPLPIDTTTVSVKMPASDTKTNESSDNILHLPVVDSRTILPTAASVEIPTSTAQLNGIEIVTPGRLTRKRKSYIGDLTISDFKTPRLVQKNLAFIKDKFKEVSVKVKKLQDHNRWADRRVKKVLDTLNTLKANGLISNNIVTTMHEFTQNYIHRRRFQNNNPNPVQFAAAYRQLLVHHEMKPSEKSNRVIDDIPILRATRVPKQNERLYNGREDFLMINDPQDWMVEEEIDDTDEIMKL